MTSHLFGGVWCASSSTYALRRTVQDSPASGLIKDTICKSFYVDDLLKSVSNADDAIKVIQETKQVLRHGRFNLTKFVVNDEQLLQSIPVQDRATEVKDIAFEMYSKALGIKWDVKNDVFYYENKYNVVQDSITKRIMLSQLSSIYYPLGLVSLVVLQGRILFQEVTRLKQPWDTPVLPNITQKWTSWLASLEDKSIFRFPRCVIPEEFSNGAIELHHFCDASEVGYGACTYLRVVSPHGKIHVAMLVAEARLAPLKQVSIPRLELSAAVIAVKLDCIIRRELNESFLKSTFWTDSWIALAYIRNESRRFKVFVANRVSVIRKHSDPPQWQHMSCKENPADVVSRGCGVNSFPVSWFVGPQILHEYKGSWKCSLGDTARLLDEDPEVKMDSCVSSVVTDYVEHPLDRLIDYHSSFYRLKKSVSWILRIKDFLVNKKVIRSGHITEKEFNQAENLIHRYVQAQVYEDEVKALTNGKEILKSSDIYRLSPKTSR